MDTGSPEVVDYRPMKTAETAMTLGDGFVAVCPYPQELRESLHYWRKSLEFNEKSRRREMRSRREELCQIVDRAGRDGAVERMLVTMPGFASRVKSFLGNAGWHVTVDDRRTPLPTPDVEKAMTGLRDYQMRLVWDLLMSNGGLLAAATGCLAEGTPVRMFDGTIKPVEQIKAGDVLLAFDDGTGQLTSSTVCDVIRTEPNHKPKPMLEVEINGERTCTTYDHPFFAGDGFYPLYQLVWGALEAGQRAQLELLCEQYGTPIDHTAVWFKKSGSNDPGFRPAWVLQDGHGWAYREGSSGRGGELAGESAWTSVRQPYRLQSCQQQGGEPGVVHAEVQCVVWGNPWQYQAVPASTAGHPDGGGAQRDTPAVPGEDGTGEGAAATRPSRAGRDTAADTDRVPPCAETRAGVDPAARLWPSFTVKAAAPYYTIRTREAPYTYCIGRRNCYLTHNCGKTYVIRALCNAFSHESLMLRGTPTIVVAAPDKDINRKNYEELAKLLPDRDVGIIMSGIDKPSDDIQVITLDSLHKLDAADVGVLIVDEVHAAASDTRSAELLRFTKAVRWGVSATPDGRFDGKDMVTEGIFGPVVSRFTFQDGVKAGALVPITVLWLPAPEPHIGVDAYLKYNTRDRRYQWGVHRNNALNALIGQIFAGIPDELQTLGMMQYTKHMEQVLRGCQAASPGHLPEQVHAETAKDGFPATQFRHMHPISPRERRAIYDRMKDGEIRKALSTHVWKQGADFTDLRIVVNIGGGGSDIVAKQVPGRASRTSAGKDRAYIIDFDHAWDTVVRDGRERPGPVLADDRSRRRVYAELGFEQLDLKGVYELPWMNNSSTQSP